MPFKADLRFWGSENVSNYNTLSYNNTTISIITWIFTRLSLLLSLIPLSNLKPTKRLSLTCKLGFFFFFFFFFRSSLFIQEETLPEVGDMTGSVLLISSAGRVWQR